MKRLMAMLSVMSALSCEGRANSNGAAPTRTGGSTTRRDAIAALCALPTDCPGCQEALERGNPQPFKQYVAAHDPHAELKSIFEAMLVLPPEQRLEPLRRAARQVGVDPCAYADALAKVVVEVEG